MLTQEQIDTLFTFCNKKYVRYYDVQVELIDHLATAIEEKMKTSPGLSFEDALQATYKSFGIFGFAKVVQEKTEALKTGYNKQIWDGIKENFYGKNWYNGLGLFIALILAAYSIKAIIFHYYFWLLIPLLFDIIYYLKMWRAKNKFKKNMLIFNVIYSINVPSTTFISFLFLPHWFEKLSISDPKFFVPTMIYCAFVSIYVIAAIEGYKVRNKAIKIALDYQSSIL